MGQICKRIFGFILAIVLLFSNINFAYGYGIAKDLSESSSLSNDQQNTQEDDTSYPIITPSENIGEVFTVTIKYVTDEENPRELAQSYIATVPKGYPLHRNIVSPNVDGYVPDKSQVDLDFSTFDQDTTIVVKYASNEVKYKVTHLQEQLDGSYIPVESEESKGKIGEIAVAQGKKYDGFTQVLPAPKVKIPREDGALDLQLKYKRNSYKVTYKGANGKFIFGGVFKFGDDLSAFSANVKNPIREGYTFSHWDKALPAKMPAENIDVNAVWEPKTKIPYTIRYFIENADNNNYSYAGSYYATGKLDQSISAPDDQPGLIFPDLSHEQQKYWKDFFVRDVQKTSEANANKTITADGCAHVDVFYKRKTVKLEYGKYANGIDDTAKNFSPVINIKGETYDENNPYVIEAKLGQDLSDKWVKEENVTNIPNSHMLYTTVLTYPTQNNKDRFMPEKYVKAGPELFWGVKNANDENRHLAFILLPKQSIGDRFEKQDLHINVFYEKLGNNISADYADQPDEKYVASESKAMRGYGGFKKIGFHGDESKMKDFGSWKAFEIKSENTNGGQTRIVNAYMKRNSYPLEIHSDVSNLDDNVKVDVLYDYELSKLDAVKTPPQKPASVPNDFVFSGWYWDLEYKHPLQASDKMPATGTRHLYAKWESGKDKVKVVFDKDNGTDSVTKQVAWNHAVDELSKPKKPGYRFIGWKEYRNNALSENYFDFRNPILSDTYLKAIWEAEQFGNVKVRYVIGSQNDEKEVISEQVINDLAVNSLFTNRAIVKNGYLPDRNYKSITVSNDNAKNVITFYYAPFKTVEYKIIYVGKEYENGEPVEKQLGSEVVKTGKSIDTKNFKEFDNYTPQIRQNTLVLSQDVDKNVMTFVYNRNKDSKYKVEYFFADNQNQYKLNDKFTQNFEDVNGKKVSITPDDKIVVNGVPYILNKEKSITEGILDHSNELVFKVYYINNAPKPNKPNYGFSSTGFIPKDKCVGLGRIWDERLQKCIILVKKAGQGNIPNTGDYMQVDKYCLLFALGILGVLIVCARKSNKKKK